MAFACVESMTLGCSATVFFFSWQRLFRLHSCALCALKRRGFSAVLFFVLYRKMTCSRFQRSRGFTLIEIVMVLVLIGILAVAALSKYFDLEKQSKQQAAKSVIAEAQSRMNALFAQYLLRGGDCKGFNAKASDIGFAILLGQDDFENQPAVAKTPLVNGSMSVWTAENTFKPPYMTLRVYFNQNWTEEDGYYDGKVYFPTCTSE